MQIPVVNSAVPKSLAPSIPVRPAWNGPPTNRGAAPTAPRPAPPPPQHPMQSYQHQPQPLMPPHMPPPVSMPTSGHVQGILPPAGPMQMIVAPPAPTHPVLDELRGKNNYNPTDFDLTAPNARFVFNLFCC